MTLAAGTGDLEAIQYLLSVGVPRGDRTGAALSAAITARCEACARLLVERGAPANALRPNGTLVPAVDRENASQVCALSTITRVGSAIMARSRSRIAACTILPLVDDLAQFVSQAVRSHGPLIAENLFLR